MSPHPINKMFFNVLTLHLSVGWIQSFALILLDHLHRFSRQFFLCLVLFLRCPRPWRKEASVSGLLSPPPIIATCLHQVLKRKKYCTQKDIFLLFHLDSIYFMLEASSNKFLPRYFQPRGLPLLPCLCLVYIWECQHSRRLHIKSLAENVTWILRLMSSKMLPSRAKSTNQKHANNDELFS